jgi:outer membrane protein
MVDDTAGIPNQAGLGSGPAGHRRGVRALSRASREVVAGTRSTGVTTRSGLAAALSPVLVSTVFAVILPVGCSTPTVYGHPGTSPSPQSPWIPPRQALASLPPEAPQLPLDSLTARTDWTLADIVDIALRTGTETRAAWAAARSAAAAYGSKRGEWLPDLGVSATTGRSRATSTGDKPANELRTYGVSVDASWLLFNFGGRRAAVEETRQALFAADWTHNATIQSTVLRVEQAYYDYFTSKALLAAEESSRQDAQTILDAAEQRHQAGLATIADVLQARTTLSQVELSLAGVQGAVATTRGALATAMGLPANASFDIDLPASDPPVPEIAATVEGYLEQAKARRPDLAAARAQARKSEAHIRKILADRLPSITATGNLGRVYRDSPDRFSDPYLATLQLRWPLFNGFSSEYDLAQSRADAETARARLANLEQAVILQVWTSYYGLRTAEQQLRMTADLLASATQSHEVAQGRYAAGVGTILDLLSTQTTLERARALRVQALSDWYISLAQLAHDTGILDASAPTALPEGSKP